MKTTTRARVKTTSALHRIDGTGRTCFRKRRPARWSAERTRISRSVSVLRFASMDRRMRSLVAQLAGSSGRSLGMGHQIRVAVDLSRRQISLGKFDGQRPVCRWTLGPSDRLMSGLGFIPRFGRLAKYDLLCLPGNLGVYSLHPARLYVRGATGPPDGRPATVRRRRWRSRRTGPPRRGAWPPAQHLDHLESRRASVTGRSTVDHESVTARRSARGGGPPGALIHHPYDPGGSVP